MATKRVEVASFYWTLTGEDILVNSSTDAPVSTDRTELTTCGNELVRTYSKLHMAMELKLVIDEA